MRTLKLTIAYEGTRLVGWQRQAAGDSVQGLLEKIIARLEGAPVTVNGAGRTDRGVHALGQVASVQVTCGHDAGTLARALNAQLPPEVRVVSVEDVEPDFHARFSARFKTYRYLLCNEPVANPFERAYAWHVPERLDVEAMRRAALTLIGPHDFAAFQSAGGNVSATVRTVSRSEFVTFAEPPFLGPSALLAYEITGDGFLRHMVRAIVGTLVNVGRGLRAPETVETLLREGQRPQAGPTAPAHGLFLVRVDYD